MPTVWIDRVWVGTGVGIAALAAWVVLWALFWDAWKTRKARRAGKLRRCAGCWYDVRGIAGSTCPECGRDARGERAMLRARRRWGMAVLGVLMVAPAWGAWKAPEVRRLGWVGASPTIVLACWPMDMRAWGSGNAEAWAEIERRRDQHPLPAAAVWILTRRLRAAWTVDAPPGSAIEEFDVGDLARDFTRRREIRRPGGGCGCAMMLDKSPPRYEPHVDRDAEGLRALAHLAVDVKGPRARNGDRGRTAEFGDRILVQGSPKALGRVRALLTAMRATGEQFRNENGGWTRRTRGAPVVEDGEWTVLTREWMHGPDWETLGSSDEHDCELKGIVVGNADSDAWTDNAGERAEARLACGRMVLWGDAEVRRGARELVESVHACGAVRPVIPWRCGPDGGLIVDVTDFVDEDGERRFGWSRPLLDLQKVMVACVASDAWADNSGDFASATCLDGCLVLRGDPEILDRARSFVEAVRRARRGETTRLGAWSAPEIPDADERVLVWDAGPLMRALGDRPPRMLDADPDLEEELWTGGEDGGTYSSEARERAERDLRAWLNRFEPSVDDLEGSNFLMLGDVAVLWTTIPGAIPRIEEAVRRAEAGWAGPLWKSAARARLGA